MKIPSTAATELDLLGYDKRVVSAAWDVAIYRDRERPIYHFSPPQATDADFAASLRVGFSPLRDDFVLIYLPEG